MNVPQKKASILIQESQARDVRLDIQFARAAWKDTHPERERPKLKYGRHWIEQWVSSPIPRKKLWERADRFN